MSNHTRWVQRGGGDFYKWENSGQELEGTWAGQKDGKFGALGMIETAEGMKTFPLHTALLNLVEGLKEGAEIKIVYTGKITNPRTAREFKAFDLFVSVEGDEAPPADDGEAPFPVDDGLPF